MKEQDVMMKSTQDQRFTSVLPPPGIKKSFGVNTFCTSELTTGLPCLSFNCLLDVMDDVSGTCLPECVINHGGSGRLWSGRTGCGGLDWNEEGRGVGLINLKD